ncbi:hypothetical protein K4K48_012209 [Colletotrichum sp. SAR 10_66]|nr:hypothetical protein K4K52_009671 [Colletotrichum sp. SAR 10_76]KAJ5003241.1 hypothetical protein K4K48_012209 [Colletotrichum sp. SAR 10_66]
MAKLIQLPAELLQKILSNFLNINHHVAYLVLPLFEPNAADLATLKAASRTCRVLRDAAEPLIWRHLCLTQPRRQGHPTTRQLIGLIRLWHNRPELAGHVHTLYFSGDDLPFGPQVIDEDDIAFLSQVLQEFGFQLSQPWVQVPGQIPDAQPWHTSFNNLSFITALIVLMARNVRALDLFVGGDFFKCMPSPGETSARLELLDRFRCHSTTGESMARMNPLLRLAPNLKKLQVWRARLGHDEDLDWSGFTSLELTDADVSEAAIANVVRSCGGLREFTFSPDTGHAPNETMAALLMHASTLQRLDINFGAEGQEDGLCVGSVAAFASLEELGISAVEMGWDEECTLHMLPKSLRSLEIHGYPRDDECRQEIEWLAGAVEAGTYPNLKEVWLSGWECDTDHPGPCWGTYVDENNPFMEGVDQHGSDWEYDSDEEEDGCDGGRTVTELRAILLEAGISCKIRPPPTKPYTSEAEYWRWKKRTMMKILERMKIDVSRRHLEYPTLSFDGYRRELDIALIEAAKADAHSIEMMDFLLAAGANMNADMNDQYVGQVWRNALDEEVPSLFRAKVEFLMERGINTKEVWSWQGPLTPAEFFLKKLHWSCLFSADTSFIDRALWMMDLLEGWSCLEWPLAIFEAFNTCEMAAQGRELAGLEMGAGRELELILNDTEESLQPLQTALKQHLSRKLLKKPLVTLREDQGPGIIDGHASKVDFVDKESLPEAILRLEDLRKEWLAESCSKT